MASELAGLENTRVSGHEGNCVEEGGHHGVCGGVLRRFCWRCWRVLEGKEGWRIVWVKCVVGVCESIMMCDLGVNLW